MHIFGSFAKCLMNKFKGNVFAFTLNCNLRDSLSLGWPYTLNLWLVLVYSKTKIRKLFQTLVNPETRELSMLTEITSKSTLSSTQNKLLFLFQILKLV